MKNTITIILIILLMYGLHSCNYVDSKINESNIMETGKKNIGSMIALYPKPLTIVGAEVDGKVNWLVVVKILRIPTTQ